MTGKWKHFDTLLNKSSSILFADNKSGSLKMILKLKLSKNVFNLQFFLIK